MPDTQVTRHWIAQVMEIHSFHILRQNFSTLRMANSCPTHRTYPKLVIYVMKGIGGDNQRGNRGTCQPTAEIEGRIDMCVLMMLATL